MLRSLTARRFADRNILDLHPERLEVRRCWPAMSVSFKPRVAIFRSAATILQTTSNSNRTSTGICSSRASGRRR